ncbi:pyruvate, phosphate dikinase [Paenibacillus psychroresistens]|uniref:Pyruvate, phosphate dikinase n=1 Tax=Paenibacillus psychroresistens TaxID=1778678 RepID=A0A6B8REV5_9BACL|nr:pyruvate, phosphate dikinase [Paenibacillus psychroresistens]QGQ93968.1 pyruvate, phosphate dikinase [Paenibacillus psychroresistens]
MAANKYVFNFQEGNLGMKRLLGGKGANLAEMTVVGLPVPPGFTVTTDACRAYYNALSLPDGLMKEVANGVKGIELQKSQLFGNAEDPLLVSVRSGSVSSMPGMMDTILNLGLTDITVVGLAKATNNVSFAYDCYRRLIQMFGNVVFGIESIYFEKLLHQLKRELQVEQDQDVTAEGWKQLILQFKACIERHARKSFPQDVNDQLKLAIEAVFRSWNNHRAQVYRRINQIPDEQGTAVNIQAMVFGNLGQDCGTGVLFTRNPSTGAKVLFGEYLTNAQGEDVVAGVRTPLPINELQKEMPEVYSRLVSIAEQLELHYRDMQDIEFTVEKNKLYMLQTRNGKRTAQAALKIGVDLVRENIISVEEALQRVEVSHLDMLLHPTIDPEAKIDVVATGLPASPGAASGQAVFDADTAEQCARAGKKVILVRSETNPEDIHGVLVAEGVLTSRGGMTSHAAVIARGMGKPCVCGCDEIGVDAEAKQFTAGDRTINEGDWISIDGATGRVIIGMVQLKEADMSEELVQMLEWADGVRQLQVFANADSPEDAAKARELGAQGIGLCRTEHMFMSAQRLPIVQAMILAESLVERQSALNKLLPMQQADFEGIFTAMAGLPVTIRLLDPPLHEFLPNLEDLVSRHIRMTIQETERSAEQDALEKLIRKVRSMHETNPMLGQRGCRLGILFPEIYEMQIEAIFRAVLRCLEKGVTVLPEIMIPLVSHANELKILRELVDHVAEQVLLTHKNSCPYKVGTMIEVPRAALTAKKIAPYADFFSFGTNDLTQMTFGYSRDDAEGKFLTQYVDQKLLAANPFQVLDRDGVGQLIELAVERGRSVKPKLKTGICGEHGGERESIFFCHETGLNYVSCSPYRVPLARIAAAQAKLVLGDQKIAIMPIVS